MSRRYWLPVFALGGFLAFSGLALAEDRTGNNEPVAENAEQQSEAQERTSKEDLAAAFWRDKDGSARTYREICEKPKDREYADLCQQWRVAEAAIEQANIAEWQLVVSVIGIVGLIGTILYTHLSYRLTLKTTQRELRAYISLVGSEPVWEPKRTPQTILSFKNTGQTPAYGLTCWLKTEFGYPASFAKPPDTKIMSRLDLGAGADYTVPVDLPTHEELLLRAILNPEDHVCLWGELNYTDVFGCERHTRFRLAPDKSGMEPGTFRMVCCEEGNESN